MRICYSATKVHKMSGARSRKISTIDPRKLIPLVGQAQHVWGKLMWEALQLHRSSTAENIHPENLTYGAINFAVTAQSLEHWLWKIAARHRFPGMTNQAEFRTTVADAVPMQVAFRDISNTFKHGEHRDDNWRSGKVELVQFPGLTGTSRSCVLIFDSEEGPTTTSLEVFADSAQQWGKFIRNSPLFTLLQLPNAPFSKA
ncbi:hypothetical protein [Sphingomonas aerolata]|uniref:hypothetical protein n=1 Tax=Sphingomonas aerolata TaxID=185951 RepID=UPI002FE0C430